MRRISVNFICLIAILCGTLNAQSIDIQYMLYAKNDQPQSASEYYQKKMSMKDPNAAFRLAVFPGVIVHGLGNMSVGNTGKGFQMLALELLSFVFIGYAGAPTNTGANPKNTLFGIGALAFIYSWVYDMYTAPSYAKKYNTYWKLSSGKVEYVVYSKSF